MRNTKDIKYICLKKLLLDLSIHSNDIGISNNSINGRKIIASLTTHGDRINEASISIESIMRGDLKPNKIILWLDKSFENKPLPISLINQQKRGLEIRYIDDIGVCTKFYYVLQEFKDDYVFLFDDDHLYIQQTLSMALNKTLETGHICGWSSTNEARIIYNFTNWEKYPNNKFIEHGGGVLYPPNIFDEEVFNKNVFLKYCKNCDDIWMHIQEIRLGLITEQIVDINTRDYITIPNFELEFGGSSLHDNQNLKIENGWTKPYNEMMKYYNLF